MNGNPQQPCPLTEQDCQTCLRIVSQSHPTTAQELERLKRAGFNLEALARDNDANLEFARGILREYFPTRAPIG